MPSPVIGQSALDRRQYWVEEIVRISGDFGQDTERLASELSDEISENPLVVLDHLRLCGAIPEAYGHDTSEEKLYSKYTDIVLAEAFKAMGLRSLVLTERADVADVEGFAEDLSFVADAKAFRMSRTAKNQKDFKVQAMDGWKHGKPYAVVVAPLYQLQSRSSQIYMQAATRNVALLSYSHLAAMVALEGLSTGAGAKGMKAVFKTVEAMTPSKDAQGYWLHVNRSILEVHFGCPELWSTEKRATEESLVAAKAEALAYLAGERERIVRLSHDEAIAQLLTMSKIDSKMAVVNQLSTNELMAST